MSLSIRHKQFWKNRYLMPNGIDKDHPFYVSWCNMKSRCYNKNVSSYKNYGGRGIKVCDRWIIFANFYDDMFENYSDGLQIDRRDNNGNYEPSNCRWATRDAQQRNKSKVKLYRGKTMQEWARELSVNYSTISMRYYKYGWNLKKAILTPVRGN